MIRLEIRHFTEAMEQTMRKHDSDKGESWKMMSLENLFELLDKEYGEVIGVEGRDDSVTDAELCSELVDLANISMMIWNRLKPYKCAFCGTKLSYEEGVSSSGIDGYYCSEECLNKMEFGTSLM